MAAVASSVQARVCVLTIDRACSCWSQVLGRWELLPDYFAQMDAEALMAFDSAAPRQPPPPPPLPPTATAAAPPPPAAAAPAAAATAAAADDSTPGGAEEECGSRPSKRSRWAEDDEAPQGNAGARRHKGAKAAGTEPAPATRPGGGASLPRVLLGGLRRAGALPRAPKRVRWVDAALGDRLEEASFAGAALLSPCMRVRRVYPRIELVAHVAIAGRALIGRVA